MKALLISDLPRSTDDLQPLFSEYKFDLIHYRSPLKALDITQHIRCDTSREEIPVILLTPPDFSADEADNAMFLGVQGITNLKETDNYNDVLEELRMIFNRYNYKHIKNLEKSVQFLFTNPIDETIITGTVKNLTDNDITFLPDMPANAGNLNIDMVLDQCSLKIEHNFIVPNCKIISNDGVLNLKFVDLSDEDKKTITDFLN